MANPRDHIRAAQAAELRGDKPCAIAELRKAAELYRRAGNSVRALQLLRHARSLDPSRGDVADEISRLEGLPDTSRAVQEEEPGSRTEDAGLELKPDPEVLAERERLIEEALRQAGASGAEAQDEMKRWFVEEPPDGGKRPVDLQEASRRALEWALRHADEEKPPREWSIDETETPGGLELRPVEEPESQGERGVPQGRFPVKPRSADVALEVKAIASGDMTALVAEVGDGSEPISEEPPPERMVSPEEFRALEELTPPSEEEPAREEPRAEERTLFDRGPTRADPAIDAWCSFCCRPRAEVGELVAGPTGSFICATCVGESRTLLALEDLATERPRPLRRKDAQPQESELVGQQEARALLERALQAGARRVLVIGPVGTGKTVWFRELARQERGALMTLEALEQGAGGPVVLVEDVDRLSSEAQERLGAFLARHPERTVLMSARGALEAPRLVLHGAAGSLPVLSTRALSEGVHSAVPVSLLEQVQIAVTLQVPTRDEFMELARRRLAHRAPELSVTEDVLAAIASEAAGSPRAGHELNALLARVLVGSWSLTAAEQGTETEEGGASEAAESARDGRRKGAV